VIPGVPLSERGSFYPNRCRLPPSEPHYSCRELLQIVKYRRRCDVVCILPPFQLYALFTIQSSRILHCLNILHYQHLFSRKEVRKLFRYPADSIVAPGDGDASLLRRCLYWFPDSIWPDVVELGLGILSYCLTPVFSERLSKCRYYLQLINPFSASDDKCK